jgi:BolA family transcriptional regulator, general stress-responsive regulator
LTDVFATRNDNKMQSELGLIGKIIGEKLTAAFSPSHLELIDESNQHHGHSGAHPSGESHFRVRIAASAFQGLGRVAQHRMVNAVLAEELKARVHALAIEIVSSPAS